MYKWVLNISTPGESTTSPGNLCQGSESQNHKDWKRPLKSPRPTINPTPPCLLNHVLKCHIYTFSEHLQGWGHLHFPGQPVPMPDHSFSKEIFLNTQSKSPLHIRHVLSCVLTVLIDFNVFYMHIYIFILMPYINTCVCIFIYLKARIHSSQ